MNSYIIITERLGLRQWKASDIDPFAAMNANPEVMLYFESTLSHEESVAAYVRLKDHIYTYGFGYFAADRLDTNEFIGFIGLKHQTYESHFTPCVDIGWRLKEAAWRQGFATEGAKACLKYGFEELGLEEIYAVASSLNIKSENIMKKIGMEKLDDFIHPSLAKDSNLQPCCLYRIGR